MAIRWFRPFLAVAVSLAAVTCAWADPAPFDLVGPKLEVKVTRAGKSLPIAEVPNLMAGDHLWIKADLPKAQSAHYLMVAAFLRGSTNPPPENWFFKQETWDKKAKEGLTVTVPEGAQQVLIFFAPETGGDFKTLMGAVRGRPGSFVRASQDLNQAMLDRSRLDTYLAAVHRLDAADPSKLKDAAPLLARSLGMKIDDKCLDRMPGLQAACLTQGQDALILSDGHSESIVEAMSSGPASDLAMQLAYTPQASYGFYSPYIGSVIDIARILETFHTAQFQYIPALATQQGEHIALLLNTPPSFHNPKSVLVTALPAVQAAQPPPLHPVDSKQNYCAQKNSLVLAVDGAPLVFSTGYAHEMTLRLKKKDGKFVDESVQPDAMKGGLELEAKDLSAGDFPNTIDASLHGYWGFEKYDGPTFRMENTHAQHWELAAADREALIVGREDTIHLSADDASCVDTILVKDSAGKELKADWKATSWDQLEVKLPLKEAHPGALQLEVKQFGTVTAQTIALRAYAEAGHLDSFTLHAGDARGILKGSGLDGVAKLAVNGVAFAPGKADSSMGSDQLPMIAKDVQEAENLKQGSSLKAQVTLTDGRTMTIPVMVGAPRPGVQLIGKSVQTSATSAGSNIQLANQDELPQDAKLRFSVRAQSPASFGRSEKIEVATEDEAFSTTLSLDNGGMTLETSKVALATLDPDKAFGASAFGPLKFRVVEDSTAGDWQPLATLVRLPELHDLKCPPGDDQQCRLSGSNLFLVDSVASDPEFAHPIQVPDGFPGYVLPVPHPEGGQLYLKLRDDPSVVNQVTLAAEKLPPPPGESHAPRAPYHEGEAAPAPGAKGQTGSAMAPSAEPETGAAANDQSAPPASAPHKDSATPHETKPSAPPSTAQQPQSAPEDSQASGEATTAPTPDAQAGSRAGAAQSGTSAPTPQTTSPQ
ncbi:MAG TPA: hypothetical protein VHE33_09180 [Acidobacteriaceae bacterium]|nr:hypothetical protein [Acidobacteriaceae bacterium]